MDVKIQDAAAFCAWASEREGLAVRLPTEAEWEHRGAGDRDALDPYQETSPPSGTPTSLRA